MAQSIAQLQQVTDNHGFLELLVIEHESFESPVRIVSDTREWVIGGNAYVALPFGVKLPTQAQQENPRAQLRVDNVGRELTALIEALPVGASLIATLQMVSRATPTVVDYEFVSQLSGLSLTPTLFTANMGPDDTMRQTAVRMRFDPTNSPGLFQG